MPPWSVMIPTLIDTVDRSASVVKKRPDNSWDRTAKRSSTVSLGDSPGGRGPISKGRESTCSTEVTGTGLRTTVVARMSVVIGAEVDDAADEIPPAVYSVVEPEPPTDALVPQPPAVSVAISSTTVKCLIASSDDQRSAPVPTFCGDIKARWSVGGARETWRRVSPHD